MLNACMPRAYAELRDRLGITPYAHQAQAAAGMLACFERYGSFGLLHEMGCGKTLTALGVFGVLLEEGLARTMLVVCPMSVIGSWERDGERLPGVEVMALTGPVARRAAVLQRRFLEGGGPLVVVTNYEAVHRMEAELRAARFDLIACDESQRIKAAGSKQSRSMHRIGRTARYRLLMTGTPIPEGSLGWYGQWRFADPELFGTSFVNYKARYAVEVDMGTFRKVVGSRNLDELEARVLSRSHRVSKAEALDLPSETDVVRSFPLSSKARRMYDKLERELLVEVEDEFGSLGEVVAQNVLTKMLRLQQLASGFASVEGGELIDVCSAKRAALRDTLADVLDEGGKVVVFHRFRRDGEEIQRVVERLGVGYARIDGRVAGSDRSGGVRRFQEDSECRVFVAQIASAGLGITLTAASTTVFYSTSFSGAEYEQARARVHRIGQSQPVNHIHLVAERTVDEYILDSLRAKRRAAHDGVDMAWIRHMLGGGGG